MTKLNFSLDSLLHHVFFENLKYLKLKYFFFLFTYSNWYLDWVTVYGLIWVLIVQHFLLSLVFTCILPYGFSYLKWEENLLFVYSGSLSHIRCISLPIPPIGLSHFLPSFSGDLSCFLVLPSPFIMCCVIGGVNLF